MAYHSDCAIKPCIVGLHVESEMNVPGTFGSHGMGGGDTIASHSFFFLDNK